MKKTLAIISAILAFSVLFSSCGSKDNNDIKENTSQTSAVNGTDTDTTAADVENTESTESTESSSTEKATEKTKTTAKFQVNFKENFLTKGKKIASAFDYKTALEEISKVDLYQKKPDFSKFTKKTVYDKDSSTSTDKYYKGSTLVYEVPNDFGERGYFHYTKTKSGKPLKVMYWDDIDCKKIEEITMDSDNFYIVLRKLDKSKPCGSNEIYVTVKKNKANDIPETAEFQIINQSVSLYEAHYYSDNGYRTYNANLNENGKMTEFENIVFSECKSVISTETVKKIQSCEQPYILQTLAGRHKLSYKQNGTKKTWFMTCSLYLIFNSKEEAESYVNKNSFGSDQKISVSNENSLDSAWYVEFSNITLPIADNFKAGEQSFKEFALNEFDDCSFADITINSNSQITSLSYNNSILSLY